MQLNTREQKKNARNRIAMISVELYEAGETMERQ